MQYIEYNSLRIWVFASYLNLTWVSSFCLESWLLIGYSELGVNQSSERHSFFNKAERK